MTALTVAPTSKVICTDRLLFSPLLALIQKHFNY